MIKKYEDLRYTDDFMFGKVMRVPSICKAVLELLLEVPIERIEYVETQKTLDVSSRSKGVRLDAYVKGSEGTLYNIEMQAARKWNLQKRSRYYQGLLDMSQLEKAYKKALSVKEGATDEERRDAELSILDLTIFENVAWAMAKNADPNVPDDPGEWLDSINGVFSVYEVLPEILELWTDGLNTTSIPAKK